MFCSAIRVEHGMQQSNNGLNPDHCSLNGQRLLPLVGNDSQRVEPGQEECRQHEGSGAPVRESLMIKKVESPSNA